MKDTLQPLTELIDQAIEILGEISVRPDHQKLLDSGYQPDQTISDAIKALYELDEQLE